MVSSTTALRVCINVLVISTPILVLLFLFAQYAALFGTLRFSTDFSDESAFIDPWRPLGRAMDREKNLRTGDTVQRIVGEPVYMDVSVPRSFDSVDVTMEYKNSGHPLVEFGLITSTEPYAVRLQPFQSTLIDEALTQWNITTDASSGLTLLQREQQYDSVSTFVANPPRDAVAATYNASIPYTYTDATYRPSSSTITIDRLLRGSHQFVVYAAKEHLHSTWSFVDMNREFNDDGVRIEVLLKGNVIWEEWLVDDGDVTASGVVTEERTLNIDFPFVEPGVYEYRISTTNDMVLTHITSDQERFVVKNALTVINNEEFINAFPNVDTAPTILTMSGLQLRAQTDHPAGLQTVLIDDEELILEEVHTPTWWEAEQFHELLATRTVVLPRNDVTIVTQGFYAFDPASYFDPNDAILPLNERVTLDLLDYILYSNYSAPEETNHTVLQHVTLSLEGVAGDRKELTFVLSAPGLDRDDNELTIERMEFIFHRDPLWKRLKKRFAPPL